jgi:hypothetical chaperone protein
MRLPAAVGVDFGTTNTVVAVAAPGGGAAPLRLDLGRRAGEGLRSALGFRRADAPARRIEVEAGERAVEWFVDAPGDTRFIQSFKTFAASPLFSGTVVHGRRLVFEDLLHDLMRCFLRYAGHAAALPRRLTVGRPVRFAGASADETLALARYRAAFARLGVEELVFVPEPVAAAHFFARRLERAATVLVADVGGGTSDFSVIRFAPGGGAAAEPLGQGGVAVAGDQFDFRVIEALVLPELGRGGRYRSFDRWLALPEAPFHAFARWERLSILKSTPEFADLVRLRRSAEDPAALDRFVALVEEDQGYPLHRAVTALKVALSDAERAIFAFAPLGDGFAREVTRADFEGWIAPDLARIEAALDATLADAGRDEGRIDRVFLTGGSAFVPALRRLFARRFGAAKLEGGAELVSIATGLALMAAEAQATGG